MLLRRKKKAALRYASLALVKEAMGAGQRFRRHMPPLLFLLALTLMIVAMSRPNAADHPAVAAARPSFSRWTSRAACAPPTCSRTGSVAAQAAAKAFVADQPRTLRIGLVAFAATATVVQSPTQNREDVVAAIDRFQLQRGTAIGSGIIVSLATMFPDAGIDCEQAALRPRSDARSTARPGAQGGEEGIQAGARRAPTTPPPSSCSPTARGPRGPDPLEAAKMAADRGVRVYTVGIGTTAGETIGFEGWSMRVRLDEETLKPIANITRGDYFYAGSAADLKKVYETLSCQAGAGEKGDRDHRAVRRRCRRLALVSAAAFSCFGSTGSCSGSARRTPAGSIAIESRGRSPLPGNDAVTVQSTVLRQFQRKPGQSAIFVSMPAIISVTNLSKTYASGFQALKNIDLDIRQGEIFALLGPNGAGKTTLISIICGIVNPSDRRPFWSTATTSSPITAPPARMIGLVPQELTTDAFETVWATVCFSRGLFGKRANPAHIEKVLQGSVAVGQEGQQDHDAVGRHEAPRADRQGAVARAADPVSRRADGRRRRRAAGATCGSWCARLRDTGVTIILTTHYIDEAEEMADRIGVINKGEIILVEDKAELMRKLGKKQLTLQLQSRWSAIPPALAGYNLELSGDGSELIYTYDAHDTQASEPASPRCCRT